MFAKTGTNTGREKGNQSTSIHLAVVRLYKLIRSTTNNNNNKLSQKVDLEMPKKKEKKMEIEFNWRESGSTRHRFQKDKKNVPVNFKFFP